MKRLVTIAEDFHILYLFITNKTITNVPEEIPANLMLVHAENIMSYYVPFVAQFAELTNFKETQDIFEEDPYDDLVEFNYSDSDDD